MVTQRIRVWVHEFFGCVCVPPDHILSSFKRKYLKCVANVAEWLECALETQQTNKQTNRRTKSSSSNNNNINWVLGVNLLVQGIDRMHLETKICFPFDRSSYILYDSFATDIDATKKWKEEGKNKNAVNLINEWIESMEIAEKMLWALIFERSRCHRVYIHIVFLRIETSDIGYLTLGISIVYVSLWFSCFCYIAKCGNAKKKERTNERTNKQAILFLIHCIHTAYIFSTPLFMLFCVLFLKIAGKNTCSAFLHTSLIHFPYTSKCRCCLINSMQHRKNNITFEYVQNLSDASSLTHAERRYDKQLEHLVTSSSIFIFFLFIATFSFVITARCCFALIQNIVTCE